MAIPQLQPLFKIIAMSQSRFLHGLDRTPNDRLGWSPGGGAPTPCRSPARRRPPRACSRT